MRSENSPILVVSPTAVGRFHINIVIYNILLITTTIPPILPNLIIIPYLISITPILPKTKTAEHGYLLKNHIPQKQNKTNTKQ